MRLGTTIDVEFHHSEKLDSIGNVPPTVRTSDELSDGHCVMPLAIPNKRQVWPVVIARQDRRPGQLPEPRLASRSLVGRVAHRPAGQLPPIRDRKQRCVDWVARPGTA